MDYSKITDFLGRFAKIIDDSNSKKNIVNSIFLKYLKKEIPKENFKIEKGILILKTNQYIKNEIFIYKEKILKDFQDLNLNIKDIK